MANDFFNQIKDDLAEYGKALGNVGKWRLIGIISRVLGLFLLILTVAFCVLALFAFGAVAVIDVLAQDMPVWAAALIICGVYVLLILIAIVARKPLFIHPFIKLLSKQIKTEEELALKTMEAEHKVEIQQLRMQSNLIARVWGAIAKLFAPRS